MGEGGDPRVLVPINRLVEALVDPARRGRTVLIVLASYAVVWTLYAALAKSSQDIHFDMGEVVAWSRDPALGTPKHPPFSAWVVGAWFSVLPLTDWAYYLLAVIVATIGLWIAWVVSGDWLDGDKRVAGLALLTLVPFFNFQALKFNANAILIPLWGATTLWFVRSFATRSLGYAALAGVAAAAAMLGKYWSIMLLAGLGVAALVDKRRAAYWSSAAPWMTAGVGLLALSPHLAWLAAHHFTPFGYALNSHASGSFADALLSAMAFLAGVAGYVSVPVLLLWVAARPSAAALKDTLWPSDSSRRFALVAFAAPLLIATLAALLARAQIVSLWAMSAMTLLPVVLLSSPILMLSRRAVVRLTAIAVAVPLVVTLAAPAIAIVIHRRGVAHHATHYRLLAGEVERIWHDTTGRPLRLIGSYTNLVNGLAFYLSDHPSTYDVLGPDQTPWVDQARIAREGIAMVCPLDEAACLKAATGLADRNPGSRRTEVSIARRYFGVTDTPQRYLIIMLPPRA